MVTRGHAKVPILRKVVKVAAHRGAMRLAPQNTIPAFQKAVELGADMIEIDVHTTADGELVVIHNSTVDGLTNGTGKVAEMTLSEIKALDAGVPPFASFKGTRIPTLAEALEFVKRAGVEVNVEIKNASVSEVVESVTELGLQRATMISSPSHDILRQAKDLCPQISTLLMGITPTTIGRALDDLHPDALNFNRHTLNEESYRIALEAGVTVYQSILGENDNEGGAALAVRLGADILETDYPGEIRKLLERWGVATRTSRYT